MKALRDCCIGGLQHEEVRVRTFALEVVTDDGNEGLDVTHAAEERRYNSPIARMERGKWGWPATLAPVRRSSPKVGRNDPCPCGSGKKFKKCCGR